MPRTKANPIPIPKTHGGKRDGAGRKATQEGGRMRTTSVRLPEHVIAALSDYGYGNVSEAIRTLVEKYLSKAKRNM